MKILLVDDDFFFQKTLSFYIQELNHMVVFAQNGEKALEIIKKDQDFDLLICDIDMSVLPGEIFIPALKTIYSEKLPVVMVISGKKNGEVFLKNSGIPYDYYFGKPMNVEEFCKTLDTIDMI